MIMSEIGNKIKEVFGGAAVYKDPANYDVFNGRNLPSFVKDYLISSHISSDGLFKGQHLLVSWTNIYLMIIVPLLLA